jgi:hypothetical protein
MNTTVNEIYALISIVLIVIILLFGFGLWFTIKAANTIFNTLNNKINTLENITFERLMLIEEQNKKINEMDETILSLIEQNKLFDKIHYNIVYDINNIEKTITNMLDDTSTQIKKLKNKIVSSNKQIKNTHANYIFEEQIKIDELKTQIIELSTNIQETNDKITNVENTMVTNEELDDAFNTLTRYLAELHITRDCITAKLLLRNDENIYKSTSIILKPINCWVYLIRYNKQFYKKELRNTQLEAPVYNVEYLLTHGANDYKSFRICNGNCWGYEPNHGREIRNLEELNTKIGGIKDNYHINIGVMEGKVIKFGTVLDRVI